MTVSLRRYVSPIYMISGVDPETGRDFSVARCACVTATITHVDEKLLAIDGLVDHWHEWGAQGETCEAALTALRKTIAAERGMPARELRTLPIHYYDYDAVVQAGGIPIFADILTRIYEEFDPGQTIFADMVTRIYQEFAPETVREETSSFEVYGRVAEPG
jgi:hypothetical protein